MLYLLKCLNFSKIGYASDAYKRIADYYTYNPCFEVLGIKDGELEDETNYHKKYEKYIPIPKTEWMLLPDDELQKLITEFNPHLKSTKTMSVLELMKFKTEVTCEAKIDNIEKYMETCNITMQEAINLFSNNKIPLKRELSLKTITNKTSYYTKHPEQKILDIEKARPIVTKMIKENITEPVVQGEVKRMLQECYNSVGLFMTANTTDINKIWLPGEYITKTRTYKNIQAGFVYPKNFKFQGNRKPVKKIDKDGNETIYESARAAALDNGYTESSGVVKRIQTQLPDKNGNIYYYI